MAYLNGAWFENDVQMHGKSGDICVETGYQRELLASKHSPPPGTYWLWLDCRTAEDARKYGHERQWLLVRITRGVGPLKHFRDVGGSLEQTWYDFSQAHWRGPIVLPEPIDVPETAAQRL